MFKSIFEQFNWTSVSIVMDKDDLHGYVMGETIDEGLLEDGYHPETYKFYGHEATDHDLEHLLEHTSEVSRGV